MRWAYPPGESILRTTALTLELAMALLMAAVTPFAESVEIIDPLTLMTPTKFLSTTLRLEMYWKPRAEKSRTQAMAITIRSLLPKLEPLLPISTSQVSQVDA